MLEALLAKKNEINVEIDRLNRKIDHLRKKGEVVDELICEAAPHETQEEQNTEEVMEISIGD